MHRFERRGSDRFGSPLTGVLVAMFFAGCLARSGFEHSGTDADLGSIDTVEAKDGAESADSDATTTFDINFATMISSPGAVVYYRHAVASDGESYGVLWYEYPPAKTNLQTMFALVSPEGKVTRGPTVIDETAETPTELKLFGTGPGRFLAVYRLEGVTGLVISKVDTTADPFEVVVRNEKTFSYDASDVFADGRGFGVAFRRTLDGVYQTHFRRFDADGLPTEDAIVVEGGAESQYEPSGSWTGTDYFIVWQRYKSPHQIRYAVLSGTDLTVATSGEIQTGSPSKYPTVISDGQGQQLISWTQGEQVWNLAVGDDGTPLWDERIGELILPNRVESLTKAMAGAEGRLGVAWESDRTTLLPQISFASLDLRNQNAVPLDPAKSESATDDRYSFCCPAISRGPGGYATIFRGSVQGERGLFFKVFSD